MKFSDVRKIALAIENVEEGTSYGTPAFKTKSVNETALKDLLRNAKNFAKKKSRKRPRK